MPSDGQSMLVRLKAMDINTAAVIHVTSSRMVKGGPADRSSLPKPVTTTFVGPSTLETIGPKGFATAAAQSGRIQLTERLVKGIEKLCRCRRPIQSRLRRFANPVAYPGQLFQHASRVFRRFGAHDHVPSRLVDHDPAQTSGLHLGTVTEFRVQTTHRQGCRSRTSHGLIAIRYKSM